MSLTTSSEAIHTKSMIWTPYFDEYNEAPEYQAILEDQLSSQAPSNLEDLEKMIFYAAKSSNIYENKSIKKPWESSEIQALKKLRHNAKDKEERKRLTLQIRKLWRRSKRQYQNMHSIEFWRNSKA